MPFKVIPGQYIVEGKSPDGDSIRFLADDRKQWQEFDFKEKINPAEKKRRPFDVQLRIEAVDALETHYEGYSQPGGFARAATDELLNSFGIIVFSYSLLFSKIVTAQDGKKGSIVTGGTDKFGRPIAMAFRDNVNFPVKKSNRLDDFPIDKSINFELAKSGLVYPTFYSTFCPSCRALFAKATRKARKDKRGLWSIDRTFGFKFWGPDSIRFDYVIMPKLFRRLIYFSLNNDSLDDLKDFLAKSNDKVLILPANRNAKFGELLKVNGSEISLTEEIENIIFLP